MKFVPAKASRAVGRAILKSKKNSPSIYFGLGLAGVVGGAVLACRATLKVEDVLEEIQAEKRHLEHVTDPDQLFTSKEIAERTGEFYGRTAAKLIKLYGPAVIVGGVGIACLTGSHRQLKARNKELTVALGFMTKAYQEYRQRVATEIGEDREKAIYAGKLNTAAGAKGGPIELDPGALNLYRFIFDELNLNFEKQAEFNRIFLIACEDMCNRKLRTRGHLFLNEALDMLGIEANGISGAVGWLWNSVEGDSIVDFGFRESEDFMNGTEPRVWLNFNVDGPIWDKF